MNEFKYCAVVQREPNAESAGIGHAGDGAIGVVARGKCVLHLEGSRVEHLDGVSTAAPQLLADWQHLGHG